MDLPLPRLSAIETAATRLHRLGLRQTPLLLLHEEGPLRIFAKLECLQPRTRCYKVRGAFNALAKLQEQHGLQVLRARGIATASAGNFAIALGEATGALELPLTVLVPRGVSSAKMARMQHLAPHARTQAVSPEVWWQCMLQHEVVGEAHEDADAPLFISPAGDLAVMEGNGTLGLELLAQLPPKSEAAALRVLVPYGGGGLAIGVACALKQRLDSRVDCQVLACEVSTGAPLHASLAAGRPVEVEHTPSFVDGIGASGVLPDNFARAQNLLGGSIVVAPDAILAQCQRMLQDYGLVVEGAGAASLAAAQHAYAHPTHAATDIVCVVSGGNIDLALLCRT